ncbi:MAG: DUF3303 domain-containing protein, partial [Candidatus Rokuibacteriota bacterium]
MYQAVPCAIDPDSSGSPLHQGRLARDCATWRAVTDDFRRCFQVMECEDFRLLDRWTARWADLIDFEIIPVMTS